MAKLLNGTADTPENRARELSQDLAKHRLFLAGIADTLANMFSWRARSAHYYNNDKVRDRHLASAREMRAMQKRLTR